MRLAHFVQRPLAHAHAAHGEHAHVWSAVAGSVRRGDVGVALECHPAARPDDLALSQVGLTSRDDAIARLERGQMALLSLFGNLTSEQMTRPKTIGGGDWSAKDLLG